jgi:hypothetical protein
VLAITWACETDSGRILARAAGHELTVDQVVEILARQNAVPNQPGVVESLANFWIDYTLIGVNAREDSLFAELDLSALLQPQLEQEIIGAYLNSVIEPDTTISDGDLRAMWEADTPADSVRAQHILLIFPELATQAQVDSVSDLATRLQARAEAGESFEDLASQYSEDGGSAVQGGDIGFFGVGMTVPSFEEAAFALEVDEVSDPVLSSAGLHIIKVTDRKSVTFEAARDRFRDSVVVAVLQTADSVFLAQITEESAVQVEAEAVDVLRELALNPRTPVGRRVANRPLVTYSGGSYSVSDALLLLNTRQTDLPAQLAGAAEQDLHDLLLSLGQTEVLLALAEDAGIGPTAERIDSLDARARESVRQVADGLGIRMVPLLEGETDDEALDRTTLQVLRELSAGTLTVIPTNAITWALRRDGDWDILESSIRATVARVDDLRGAAEQAPAQPTALPAEPAAADSIQE